MRNIYVTGTATSTPKYQLFTVDFFGSRIRTIVTSNVAVIRKWIQSTRFILRIRPMHQSIVGLGVQWFPSRSFNDPPADTLQLCVGNRCLIIKLSRARSVPRILRRFLGDPEYKFVGIRNTMDAVKLKKSVHDLSLRNLINLVGYSTRRPSSSTSMETMAFDFLGFNGVIKDPMIGMSRWNAKLLDKRQVQYACVDAHVSFLIAKKLGI